MNSLRELQNRFLKHISGQGEDAYFLVESTPKLSASERLRIYQHAYVKRLQDVVDEDYPCLGLLLGDDAFETLLEGFVRDTPPRHPSVRWYSDALPDWLRQHPRFGAYPAIAEMAQWEQRLRWAFDAPNSETASLQSLQRLLPEQWPLLKLQLIPALSWLDHRFNTVKVWQALKEEVTPPSLQELDDPERWLIFRPQLTTQYRSLAVDEAVALELVQRGADFTELCVALTEWHEDNAGQRAAGLLQTWFNEGLIQRWSLD